MPIRAGGGTREGAGDSINGGYVTKGVWPSAKAPKLCAELSPKTTCLLIKPPKRCLLESVRQLGWNRAGSRASKIHQGSANIVLDRHNAIQVPNEWARG